jgi:hypothetical protein
MKKKSKKTTIYAGQIQCQGGVETDDLPIFRTTVMASYPITTVLDLRRKIHAVIGERRRTNANETEKETT